ncbi:hypothetical protein [Sphaerisporangium sp. TRM90804]|uniref:hypothetical protein n=1 Tax=Sphaerisporangium sp. TRM90804 TaxID=3031113 RepID=UPI0024485505|nr:hypothetical protein [Sphaerisporangium sp. TRM90804]MDH2425754.1 hypothetical protein [Sphaerisporangium sp. TRM90804]
MSDAFEAADVPALRRDTLTWLTDGRGFGFHAQMSRSAGSMLGRPDLDGNPAVMRAYAELVCEQETRALRDAELYYVTAEMTRIVRAAAADLPAFVPAEGDFPSAAGLIVFESPLAEYRRPENDISAMIVEGRVVMDFRDQPYEDTRVVAATWSPCTMRGSWEHGGVWMGFYTSRALMLERILDDRVRDDLRPTLGPLVPDNECGIKYVKPAEREHQEELLRAHDQPGYTSHWAKYLMATLLLMRQPLTYQRTEPIRRGLRRQLERSGLPAGPVQILDARPRRYTTVPRDQEAEDQPEEDTSRKLSVRFPVRGFWRQQWYPSRGLHRPKWIAEHWRGPDDAPIAHPERVRVLRSHPAQPNQETDHG